MGELRASLRRLRFLFFKLCEVLEETINVYSRVTPGPPVVTVKSIENVIANDNDLSGMDLKAPDMLDLSYLERLEDERKTKAR